MSDSSDTPQDPDGQNPEHGQPGGYGPPPYSISTAFNYGWTKFQANVGPIIVAVIALIVVTIVIQQIGNAISGGFTSTGTTTLQFDPETGQYQASRSSAGFFGAAFLVSMLFGFLAYAASLIIQSGIIKASLDITHGRKVDLKEMFNGLNLVQVVIASLIIGVATFIGLILCVIPGLAVMFFTWFTLYFVIDKQMSAVEAISASIGFVKQHAGMLIGFFLASLLAYFVGALLCGLGLLVAIPVVVIAQAYTFRTLQGETVAA